MAQYLIEPPSDSPEPSPVTGKAGYPRYVITPPEKPGVVEDVAKSVATAPIRAAAGLASLPHLITKIHTFAAQKLAEAAGMDPAKAAEVFKPLLPDMGELVMKGWDEIGKATVGAPVYKPQTAPGRVADTAAQVMVGGPGSIVQKGVTGVAAGGSGELARRVTDNPIAIGVAQLLGGGAASLPWILRSVPAENIKQAIAGITEADLTKAQSLMDDAAKTGTPLTGAEALAQITGKNTLQDIQRVVESSQKGGPVTQPMMNARPDANRAAFTTQADTIAPQPANPAETAGRVQGAAADEVRRVQKYRTAATQPYYEAQAKSDATARAAAEALPQEERRLAEIAASKNAAVQEQGKFDAYGNAMAQRENAWYPVEGQPRAPGRYSEFPERRAEAAAASADAEVVAAQRKAEVAAQEARVADVATAAQIPLVRRVQDRVSSMLLEIDDRLKMVGPKSTEGKVLAELRQEIAPNGEPVKYASQLESAYKSTRDKLDVPTLNATPEQKTAAGVLGPYVKTMDRAVQDVSENLKNGRQVYRDMSERVVGPVERSPIGDLSKIPTGPGASAESGMKATAEILTPTVPRALNPETIKQTVRGLNRQDPTAARDWARQNLQALFDEATQNLVSGQNQWGGAKFAAQIAGNPSQKDNLQALIESVSDRKTWNGFNRLLEVMEAQGKRQAPGSQTAQNAQLQGSLSAGGAGSPIAAVASPNKAMSVVGQWYDQFRFGKNTEEMARILTDPKSVDLMRQLAKEAPMSSRATALAAEILSSQAPAKLDETSTPNR